MSMACIARREWVLGDGYLDVMGGAELKVEASDGKDML
jgi:hypothetical protein